MPSINRRELAKGLTAGVAASSMSLFSGTKTNAADLPAPTTSEEVMVWKEIHPGIWRARLGQPEVHTPTAMRLVPPATEAMHRLPQVPAPSIDGVRGAITSRGCLLSLPMESHELMYGFGLQLLSFQQRGSKKTIRVNADPKVDSGDSHAPVPFYVTTKGYGILVDTLRHVEFYCGEAHAKPTQPVSAQSVVVNTPQETRERDRGEASRVLVEVPRAAGVDIYLFAGPSMLEAVQRYNLFSGGGIVPPEWGLGFWYRPEMHDDNRAVLSLAQEFRERKIPCDVLGLEPGWQTHAYSCSFVWDSARFPDPRGFLQNTARLNYKVNLWEHAFTHPSSPIFEPLVPNAGDYAVWEGLVPDFAGEPARKIFGDYHGKHLIDAGVSGFKLDECDNSDFTAGWSFPDMSRFPSGLDGEQMHAVFGLRYQHAIWQQFQDRHQPTYSLVRSSGALAAPYPFVLYSDLYDHRQFIRGLVNSGFSGLLWCPEVRDAASEEDLIRRLQSVVFSPLAMVNAWYIKNPPWKQLNAKLNNEDHLEENWQILEARCREIIGWRMQLVPYLRSAFHRYAFDGTPPFRALVLDYPGEKSLQSIDDAYMIGDRMLVAPLFAGENGRKITLPSGEWHDFWTGHLMQETSFSVPASMEKIPVFVKGGSVVPLATVGASNAEAESRELTIRVYGDGHLPWRMMPTSGMNLELSWNAAGGNGNLQQRSGSDRPYRVVRWQQMG
jgi:alpha-D-xyloside xylohydrolase